MSCAEHEEFEVDVDAGGGWDAVTVAFARKIESLQQLPERYVILSAGWDGPFLQFNVSPEEGILAEIRADYYASRPPLLDRGVAARMLDAGWGAPEGIETEPRPNWWRIWPKPVDIRAVCEEVVSAFVEGFGLSEQTTLELKIFPADRESRP